MLTEAELKTIPERVAKARAEVIALANGSRRWRMCVPVQSDDSDTVLMAAIDDAGALLENVNALRAALAALVSDERAQQRGYFQAGVRECFDYRDCCYCDAMSDLGVELVHEPDCPVAVAKRLIGRDSKESA